MDDLLGAAAAAASRYVASLDDRAVVPSAGALMGLGLLGGSLPLERAEHEAGGYDRWFVEHAFVLVPAQAIVGQHLATFQQFPPRQKPGSFSVDQAMQKLTEQTGGT